MAYRVFCRSQVHAFQSQSRSSRVFDEPRRPRQRIQFIASHINYAMRRVIAKKKSNNYHFALADPDPEPQNRTETCFCCNFFFIFLIFENLHDF